MSHWTYIHGAIEVHVPGRTQAECTYVLQTVLNHLPKVYGSEGDMEIYVNKNTDAIHHVRMTNSSYQVI